VTSRGLATTAIHGAGADAGPPGTATPVVVSATFRLDAAAYADVQATGGRYTTWYTRLGNPTVEAVARTVAALEGADAALLYASGMAAIAAALHVLAPAGARVVAARELYGDTYTLLTRDLPARGCAVELVPIADRAGWERALATPADVVFVETLSNPMLRVADLPALADAAHAAGAVAVVDATFTSPLNVRPLHHGFDLVLHSATKYLNGHSDLVAGVAAGHAEVVERVRRGAEPLGACLDPRAASLLERGLKTLAVRMDRHNANALRVAGWLEGRPEVEAVAYPLLPSHPDHALAERLLAGGSGLVAFRVAGGDEAALRVLDGLRLILQATSLGGVESLASAPFNTSHVGLSEAERVAAGILPGTIRLSVGIEEVEDLLADLDGALRSAG
jgi:cystathionine beta-lyase/cystathionine gamma-synthase